MNIGTYLPNLVALAFTVFAVQTLLRQKNNKNQNKYNRVPALCAWTPNKDLLIRRVLSIS